MANKNLNKAKETKNDEFYTQYSDIQKEIEKYLEYNPDVFRGKVVYCNCDDPFESNFFRYFVLNFNKLGLKQLITTSYKPSPVANTQLGLFGDDKTLTKSKGRPKVTANKFIINEVHDIDGDGECNMNAITYKEVFPLLKVNKVWLGNNYKVNAGAMFFEIPEKIANLDQVREIKTNESGKKVYITRVQGIRWFTNLDHGRRHQPLQLMTKVEVIKFTTKKPFEKYENYDAIEISLVKNIPSDYKGVMGVPVSFLD